MSSTAADPLPTGGYLEQADGTAWMAMFSLQLMTIALELARANHVYQDVATKYFEHFLYIAGAMNDIGGEGVALWDDDDGFFYDVLRLSRWGHDAPAGPLARRAHPAAGGGHHRIRGCSTKCPAFPGDWTGSWPTGRSWPASCRRWRDPGSGDRRLLSLVRADRMKPAAARGCSTLTSSSVRTVSGH